MTTTWLRWLSPNSGNPSMWHSVTDYLTHCGHYVGAYPETFEHDGENAPVDYFAVCLLCKKAVELAARKREKLERIESEPRKKG